MRGRSWVLFVFLYVERLAFEWGQQLCWLYPGSLHALDGQPHVVYANRAYDISRGRPVREWRAEFP